MLGLKLRKEFQGKILKGTAIELSDDKNTGATQVSAKEFLEITYPSSDLLKALEATTDSDGRPIVLIGERGQGKSHLLAVLYHALKNPDDTKAWLQHWSDRLNNPKIAGLKLHSSMHVISESLHRHSYRFLWDILFERHPHGKFISGKWEGLGKKKTDIPSTDLILELLKEKPTALILDEFQTWYDGLKESKDEPDRAWAFNFIQNLSEIAKEHPDLLLLIVSVRNGNTEAYQQIHRVSPLLVDFKGPSSAKDRRKLLLHRLFENRQNIQQRDIEKLIQNHLTEYCRLMEVPSTDHEKKKIDFLDNWPFASHLMQLLEDQILVATDAQETRDLIRILADLFKSTDDKSSILTAANFLVDHPESGYAALLDSVTNQHHANLREKALRNLQSVSETVEDSARTIPHLSKIISSLWLRSIAVDNLAGADSQTLHVDITADKAIDDNLFQVELSAIIENSFNIHQVGDRLIFKEEENPQAKLMATARNDRLFSDGSDIQELSRQIKYVLSGNEQNLKPAHVIVLPSDWQTHPWEKQEIQDQPANWDERSPILVLPEIPKNNGSTLGLWLKDHLQKLRNTVRFIYPRTDLGNLFINRQIVVMARAVLKAKEWANQNRDYEKLRSKFQGELQAILKEAFNRFLIIEKWNFSNPAQCEFHSEVLKEKGGRIIEEIEKRIHDDLFIPEVFEELVFQNASESNSIGKLLRELKEPRPNGESCIPWVGDIAIKEKLVRLVAQGKIAINVRGMDMLQLNSGETEDEAWKRMRGKIPTGTHLDETQLVLPQAVTGSQSQPEDPTTPAPTIVGSPTSPLPNPSVVATPTTSIFGGGGSQPNYNHISIPATSALNLIGKIESQGINAGTPIRGLEIKVDSLSGAQLQKLLRTLPDGLTFELSLKKEEV